MQFYVMIKTKMFLEYDSSMSHVVWVTPYDFKWVIVIFGHYRIDVFVRNHFWNRNSDDPWRSSFEHLMLNLINLEQTWIPDWLQVSKLPSDS